MILALLRTYWPHILIAVAAFSAAWELQGLRWDLDVGERTVAAETAKIIAVNSAAKGKADECNILLEKKDEAAKKNMAGCGASHALVRRVYAECGTLQAPDGVRSETNGNYRTGQHFCMGAGYLADLIERGNKCSNTENTAISLGATEAQ